MHIELATAKARAEYRGLYPLHGYVHVPARGHSSGICCPVEDLRGSWERDNPQWEVLAPDGWMFSGHDTHSLLGFTQRDLLTRISELEPDAETA